MNIRSLSIAAFVLAGTLAGATQVTADDLPRLRDDYLRGRYAEVVEALQDPPQPAGAVLLARSLEALGRREEAYETLQKVEPSAATLAEMAHLSFQRGDVKEAAELATKAIALESHQPLARWVHAEVARAQGELDVAQDRYEWFIDYYNAEAQIDDSETLFYIGEAAAQYARWTRNSGQFQFLVSDLYPEIVQRDPNFWPAQLAISRLFAEKYNLAQAVAHLNKALAINPHSCDIMAHKAALELNSYEVDAALRTARQALKINPQHVAAWRLQGHAKLADFRPEQAIEALQQAVELNRADQTSWGLLACAHLAADGPAQVDLETGEPTPFGKLLEEVQTRHSNLGEFYAALGDGCDTVRKYPEAVKYLQQARRLMPQLIAVHGDLGMTLMRLGEEELASQILDEAFKADPFNVRVKNTLEVLDVLKGYDTIETEHFLIRFDPEKDRLLAQYMSQFLEEQVHPLVCQGLAYTPPDKTLIEIFNDARNTKGHGWFSARMVGLPYIGTVGACAGKMIALTSPNAVSQPYNWAHVVRHEFVHVVNLQQTDFNIPHWFTEALAVSYESDVRPPDWDQLLARRLAQDQIFNLDTINYGFIRPNDHDDWTMAYCQAYYYAQFIVKEFGDDALQRMLNAYRNYRTTDQILAEEFQIEKVEFERQYVEFLRKRVQGVPLPPGSQKSFAQLLQEAEANAQNADAQAELAHVYLKRKSLSDARRYAAAALRIDEDHPLALYVMGRLLLSIGDTDEALQKLERATSGKRFERHSVALLAALRLRQQRPAEALELYQQGSAHEPGHPDWQESILRVHLLQKDNEALMRLIPKVAAQKHHDPLLRKKMAEILLQQQQWEDAQQWAFEAIGINVQDPQAHALLGAAFKGQQKLAEAAQEFEIAGQLKPQSLAWSVEAAQLYQQSGDLEKARQVAKHILDTDSTNTAAQAILDLETETP